MTKLLTIKAAAKSSGIGVGTLRRLIASGDVRSVRIPGRQFLLIDPADISAFIEASKSGSLSGSIEIPRLEKVQSSSAQNEKSQRPRLRKSARLDVPYFQKYGTNHEF